VGVGVGVTVAASGALPPLPPPPPPEPPVSVGSGSGWGAGGAEEAQAAPIRQVARNHVRRGDLMPRRWWQIAPHVAISSGGVD